MIRIQVISAHYAPGDTRAGCCREVWQAFAPDGNGIERPAGDPVTYEWVSDGTGACVRTKDGANPVTVAGPFEHPANDHPEND